MTDELISITQIAEELGRNKQFIFKLADRFGLEKTMQKSSLSRGQKIAYISQSGFRKIQEYLSTVNEGNNSSSDISFDSSVAGVFYLIQLEPEHDSGRFKLGFTSNLEERLRAHKTAAPYSTVIATWPCKLLWEKTAIESVTQNCEQIHTEVFRHHSISDIEQRCDNFFALMPNPDNLTS